MAGVASPSLSISHYSTPQLNNPNSNVRVTAPSAIAVDDESGLHTPRAKPRHEVIVEDPYPFDRRPLIRYSRRVLLHLSRSPLVTLPPNMPEFSAWYGEWTEPHVKKDDHSSSQTSSSNRHRPRREQLDEDSRPMFKSQFSQASQMGNFRHHPSRLDDKGDRDSHERLRNLADSYDRSRLLNGAARRDPGSHTSRNGAGLAVSVASSSNRRGDTDTLPGRERRELTRGERSDDWRRGADKPSEADTDFNPPSDTKKDRTGSHRLRSRSRDVVHGRPERQREREKADPLRDEDKEWERIVHGSGRRSPSPGLPPASSRTDRWAQSRPFDRDENRDRDTRARTNDLDDPSRRLDRRGIAGGRDGRKLARDADREDEKKSDTRNVRDRGRDKDRGRAEEKEPAWMDDYVPDPNDTKSGILGGQRADDVVDDLQAWKRGIKKSELGLGSAATSSAGVHEAPSGPVAAGVGLEDIQMFNQKLKEQERQERADDARIPLTNPPPPPPGLTATTPGDYKQDQSAALVALLSPLALQLQQDMEVPSDPPSLSSTSQPPKPNLDDITSSRLSSSSSLPLSSLSFNRYPDIIPELTSPRDPLIVAGLPSAGRAFDDLGSRSESRVSNPTASSPSDIRIPSQQQLTLNGRLTPTNSNPTPSSAPSAQSTAYSGEGSPSSGNALPAYAQSKGSRFAKFWDNKPKDQAVAFNPSQPLAPPSNSSLGSPLGTWSGGNSVPNDPRAAQASSPLRQTPADSSGLNSLLRNMSAPVSGIPPNDRPDFMDRPASRTNPDADRMQRLLSMLTSQQQRQLNNINNMQEPLGPPFRHPAAQNGSLNSVLGQGLSASQSLPQPQQQLLPFSPVGSPDFDRTFVPDGLVPGLRPSRARDMDQAYFPTPPPTNNSTLNQFHVNEDRMSVNSQQSFDHVPGRPSPGAFPGQGGPGMIHTSGRSTAMLNSSPGGAGPGLSNNRHSPGLMQGPQHLQRGLLSGLPTGRGSEPLLNMPSAVGNQGLGSLAPNGSLMSVGAPGVQNPGLQAGSHRGLPSQMGMINGNAFGNMPNQEPIFQQPPQIDLQSRLAGSNLHGSLPGGPSASGRASSTQSMEPTSQRMFHQPPSHPQFQQHPQPPMIRPQSHASLQGPQQHHHHLGASSGLPLNIMGLGQSIRHQISTHGHQITQASPHGHLLHPQHPQLQNSGGDFNNQQHPFLSQQPLQHTQPSGIGGLQNAGGRTQAQAQQDLIALLMGGQSGHTMQ